MNPIFLVSQGPWDGIIRSWVNAVLAYHPGQQPIASSNMFDSIINRQGDWPSAVAPKLHNLPQVCVIIIVTSSSVMCCAA